MKACPFMFMVVNGHHRGSLSTFPQFKKILFLGVWPPFFSQNLPKIRHFHKVGGDILMFYKEIEASNGITRDL